MRALVDAAVRVVALTWALGAFGCDRRATLAPDPAELTVVDVAIGTGDPVKQGDHVRYEYTVRLLGSSDVLDTNVGKEPYPATIGEHKVIAGMEQGLVGMRVGGKRHLVLPSRLAYGAAGKGDRVPPHAALEFDVVMLGIGPAQAGGGAPSASAAGGR